MNCRLNMKLVSDTFIYTKHISLCSMLIVWLGDICSPSAARTMHSSALNRNKSVLSFTQTKTCKSSKKYIPTPCCSCNVSWDGVGWGQSSAPPLCQHGEHGCTLTIEEIQENTGKCQKTFHSPNSVFWNKLIGFYCIKEAFPLWHFMVGGDKYAQKKSVWHLNSVLDHKVPPQSQRWL